MTLQDFDLLYRLTALALESARAGRRDDGEALLWEGLLRLLRERPDASEFIQRWETTLAGYREEFPPERGRRSLYGAAPGLAC